MKYPTPKSSGPHAKYPKRAAPETGVIGSHQGSFPKTGIHVTGGSTSIHVGTKMSHHAVKTTPSSFMDGGNHFSGPKKPSW